MMFSVKLDKASAFVGQQALLRLQGAPLRKKLVTLVLASSDAYVWGGEAILQGGKPVGEISSAGWSLRAGTCVALGYVRGAAALAAHSGTPAQIELWGEKLAVTLYDQWQAKP